MFAGKPCLRLIFSLFSNDVKKPSVNEIFTKFSNFFRGLSQRMKIRFEEIHVCEVQRTRRVVCGG